MPPNDPAHRLRADGARNPTETHSRRSVQPLCSEFSSRNYYILLKRIESKRTVVVNKTTNPDRVLLRATPIHMCNDPEEPTVRGDILFCAGANFAREQFKAQAPICFQCSSCDGICSGPIHDHSERLSSQMAAPP